MDLSDEFEIISNVLVRALGMSRRHCDFTVCCRHDSFDTKHLLKVTEMLVFSTQRFGFLFSFIAIYNASNDVWKPLRFAGDLVYLVKKRLVLIMKCLHQPSTRASLLFCLLYSLFDSNAMFCILLLCLLLLFCFIVQAITVLFERSERLFPPVSVAIQTQNLHKPNELFRRCPHNRLHRDHGKCYPLG